MGESNRTRHDCHIKKNRGCTVSKSLRARAGSLRRGDEPHDSGEGSLVADCRNADTKATATYDCSRDNCGACPFLFRFGLASDHGYVNIGNALNDSAICRDTGSGPDKNDVANAQLREWNRLSVWALYALGGVGE